MMGAGAGLSAIGGAVMLGASTIGNAARPDINRPVNVDPTESQKNTIAGNLKNAPEAEALATRTTNFNTQQILKMLMDATGGSYTAINKQMGQNLLAGMKGQLSLEDANATLSRSASKAMGMGYLGGTGKTNLVARDLNLAQLQIQKSSMDSMSRWFALQDQTFSPGFYSMANSFMDVNANYSKAIAQNQWNYAATLNKSMIDAQADPGEVAFSRALSYQGGVMQGMGGSMMGAGMMGGGGGGISGAAAGGASGGINGGGGPGNYWAGRQYYG